MRKARFWPIVISVAAVLIAPIPLKLLKLITCPWVIAALPLMIAVVAAVVYVLAVVGVTASALDY